MKIEKISDTQIKVTLNHSDLMDRDLKLSELAYGSQKAQALFKDMMAKANEEFGFETDNVPLMIEAVPLSTDSIMIVVTKVDTRKNYFKQTFESLRELDDLHVFDTFIRVDSSVEWSQDNNMPIMAYKRSSRSAQEYMALTEEIVNRK